MSKIRTFISAGLASLLMASCVVSPHIAHIPIYEQQGDMQVSGSLSVWNGASASAGVAITDHIAMQTTASLLPVNGIISTQTSLGYYLPFENHAMLGIYGGYGNSNGWEYYDHGDSMGRIFVSDNRYFVQVDYGWMRPDQWGIAGRLTTGYSQSGGCLFIEPALNIPMLTGPLRVNMMFSYAMFMFQSGLFPIPNVGLGVSYNIRIRN